MSATSSANFCWTPSHDSLLLDCFQAPAAWQAASRHAAGTVTAICAPTFLSVLCTVRQYSGLIAIFRTFWQTPSRSDLLNPETWDVTPVRVGSSGPALFQRETSPNPSRALSASRQFGPPLKAPRNLTAGATHAASSPLDRSSTIQDSAPTSAW